MDAVAASGLLAQGQIAPCRRPLLSNAVRNESHEVRDPDNSTTHHVLTQTDSGRVVTMPDLQCTGQGTNPGLPAVECNLGKLLTHMCLCHQAV